MSGVPPHRRDVAMVFQNPALYPHLSVFDNLAFGLKARGIARGRAARRVQEVAEMLGLERLLDRRPASSPAASVSGWRSGGRWSGRPAVLLLDEPFSSLDEPLRAALRAELVELHRRFGSTLVHVTHDQGEAMSLGQRWPCSTRAGSCSSAPPAEIYERPAHRFVAAFVGSPRMNYPARLGRPVTIDDLGRPPGGGSIHHPGWPGRSRARRPRSQETRPRSSAGSSSRETPSSRHSSGCQPQSLVVARLAR